MRFSRLLLLSRRRGQHPGGVRMPAETTSRWGWFLNEKTTLLVVVAVALLIATELLTRQRFVVFEESSQWIAHTHEVIGGIESIQAALMDGETGMRGYLVT